MFPLIKKAKDKFVLSLNKNLYKKDIVDRAVFEDKNWIRALSPTESHFCLELNTSNIKEVLDWANYLLYLDKAT